MRVVVSSHFRESHGPWPTHGGPARDRTVVRAWSLLTDDRQKLTMRSSISGAGAQGRKSNLYVFDADRTSVLNVKRLKEHREHDFEIELFANFNNHCYLFAL